MQGYSVLIGVVIALFWLSIGWLLVKLYERYLNYEKLARELDETYEANEHLHKLSNDYAIELHNVKSEAELVSKSFANAAAITLKYFEDNPTMFKDEGRERVVAGLEHFVGMIGRSAAGAVAAIEHQVFNDKEHLN